MVEWLRRYPFTWKRSTKDYHKKKDAWRDKARELDVEETHLSKWWKNIKVCSYLSNLILTHLLTKY